MEILEAKNTILEIQMSLVAFNKRMEMTEKKFSELEERATEIIQFEKLNK